MQEMENIKYCQYILEGLKILGIKIMDKRCSKPATCFEHPINLCQRHKVEYEKLIAHNRISFCLDMIYKNIKMYRMEKRK